MYLATQVSQFSTKKLMSIKSIYSRSQPMSQASHRDPKIMQFLYFISGCCHVTELPGLPDLGSLELVFSPVGKEGHLCQLK